MRASARLVAAAAALSATLLTGACAGDPSKAPSAMTFAQMNKDQRQATWDRLPPAEKQVLNCRLDMWVAYTNASSGSPGGTGPREWSGNRAGWIDYSTGRVPGIETCDRFRESS